MKTEITILIGINNLKAQLKKVMTEASTLEVMIREMESSLCGVDNDRACWGWLRSSLLFSEIPFLSILVLSCLFSLLIEVYILVY